METQNPATPAQAATPGSVPQNGNPAPVASPAPTSGTQGNNQEGSVTISLKEYRDLQRANARALSFDKRSNLNKTRQPNQTANVDENADPELVQRLNSETQARQEAERRAMQAEVRGKVRDLLEKEEFKKLPASTKNLILQNPHMLSQAETLDEAMLDIEDFVRDQVLSMDITPVTQPNVPQAQQPAGHEAPPVVATGAPAPANAQGMEDLTKLSGPARSQAAIRNAIKGAKGTVKV